MAAAYVQHLGASETTTPNATTTVLSISKTVTSGDLIVVGHTYYGTTGAAPSATDNLGNTYTLREHIGNNATSNTSILTAPVTVAGTLTTITVTHDSRGYRAIIASEYSGVGAFSAAGGGSFATSTTSTWAASLTIPANGIAFGMVGSNNNAAQSAGAASGSPSTTVVLDTHYSSPGSASDSIGAFYAIAGGSDVTSFSGTATHASIAWSSVGAVFSPGAHDDAYAEAATAAVWASAGIGSDLDLDAPHIPATGAAAQPGPSVAVSAAAATATGAALDPSRVAPAEHIAATAQAHGVSASIKAAAAAATATGAAPQPLPGVAQMAGLASSAASVTAHQPTIDVDSYAYAEHIAATGTASDAAPSVGASANVATATGEAIDGSCVGQGSSVATVSPPILITASVPVASIAVAFNAEVASSIGAASGAAPSVGASAGLASATGAAGAVLSPLAMTGGGPGPRSHAHVPGPRVIVTPHAPRPTVVVPRPR